MSRKNRKLAGEYFCGNKISDYGIENGRLDYCTLAKAFSHVMANDLVRETSRYGIYWEPIHGYEWDDDGEYPEVFQYFIVGRDGAEIIEEYTDDPLFYCEELDLYLWGVTHWGTSWDYVLTDVKINCGESAWLDDEEDEEDDDLDMEEEDLAQ